MKEVARLAYLFFVTFCVSAYTRGLVTYTRGLDLSGSLQGAGGIGGLLARADSNGSTFYHSDGAGNVTALMDSDEDIVGRYMYGPFGKLTGIWGSMAGANEMQFLSMLYYSMAGISGYYGRFYDSNLGRSLNQDPVQERGGINLYRFNFNNPLNWIDPLGLQTEDEDDDERPDEIPDGELSEPNQPIDAAFEPAPNQPMQPLTDEQFEQNMAQVANEFAEGEQNLEKEIADANEPKQPSSPSPAARVPCPNTVYRSGRPSPSNLKTRPGENAVSFRASLSNPIPNTGRPVFPVGGDYFGVDTSQLPEGSVIYDNAPPEHVSI